MNREEIIKLAREAGGLPDPMVFIGAYERFAALVADAERHECAKIVDGNADGCNGMTEQILRSNAAAIRARGQA
jgi:hypothetical protein